MTQYPPLYPAVLTPLLLVGIDALQAARLLNAFLFGVNILLAGYSIHQITRSNRTGLAFVFAGGLVFTLSSVLIGGSFLAGEPLYLSLLGFCLGDMRRFKSPNPLALLWRLLAQC
jgi:hypothetical protein